MLSGKDRGKSGRVLSVLPEKNRVVVEGLNTVKKNVRPKQQGQKGQIIIKPQSVDVSNAIIVCSKCGKATRVRYGQSEKNKIRICRKCGLQI